MNKIAFLTIVLTLGLWALTAPGVRGDDSVKTGLAKRIEGYMKAAQAGQGHKAFETMGGSFQVNTQLEMPGMKIPAAEGTASGTLQFGGRYLELQTDTTFHTVKSTMKMVLTYNAFKKHYQFVMYASTGNALESAHGNFDEETGELVLKGVMEDAMAGKRNVRHVFRFEEKGFVFETYDTLPTGKELRMLVMKYRGEKG